MRKVIITAAICGAEVTKEHNPAVPYTVKEIAKEAKRSYDAGASIIHLHVRQDDGTPTQSYSRFKECMQEIKSLCPDVIIQPSTGGAAGMAVSERIQPVELKPEMATLDCGTLNFGYDDIFVNKLSTIIEFAEIMNEKKVKPELEVFDKSMIDTALYLNKKGYILDPMHFNLVLGVRGGIGATLRDFSFLVDSLPKDSTFTASGIGKNHFSVAAMSIVSGGHVRVGFEDNIYMEEGVFALSNGELVERAVTLVENLNEAVADPKEARKILSI